MKKLLYGLLVFCFMLAVPLQAQETRTGNLQNQPIFDRPGDISYSINCDASYSYTSPDVEYMVFSIYTTVEEPVQAFLSPNDDYDDDSYLLLYCDGFDPANPTANLVAGDDDGGFMLGGTEYSSAFTVLDNYVIHANTHYKLVVTAYDAAEMGSFILTLGGHAHFVEPMETRIGNLSGEATFDRPDDISYSINCDASYSYTSPDVEYKVFTIYSTVEEPLKAFLNCSWDDDSYLLLYCDGFDPANPTANLVAGDDDEGYDYYGGSEYSSGFTALDGYIIHAYTPYKLVVTGYDSGALTGFQLNIFGNAHFIDNEAPLINASTGPGGSISPAGSVPVSLFSSKTFSIQPDSGYYIANVIVDGVSVGAVNTYTLQNVTADHTIYANFVGQSQPTFTITASAESGGSISPSGTLTVGYGSDQTFLITPYSGYHVQDVTIDGLSAGPVESFTFSNVRANHEIQAVFTNNQPPVITSFTADKLSGLAPLTVHFDVSANDPDGGRIVQYYWDFNGDGMVDQITTEGSVNHRFVTEKDYPVNVTVLDDEGESANSEILTISVSKTANINLPILTDMALKKDAKSYDLHADTWAVDPFDEDATVVLTAMNDNDEQVAQTTMVIPGHGKAKLALGAFDGLDYSVVKVHADRYLLYFTDMAGSNSRMASYIRTPLKTALTAPHIAEETAYWDTFAFLSDEKPAKLNLKMGTQTLALTPQYSNVFDLDAIAGSMGETAESAMWSKFVSYANNPFADTSLMTGFEIFIKHDGDGAATELGGTGSTKLYIPHIPAETDIFWTGFAFVNPGQEAVTATATFYSDAGVKTGTSQITVPANSKLKGLMSDIFPNAGTGAAWGTVNASGNLVGLEIYGTVSGICGFSLKGEMATDGVFPLMVTGENNWTGIALANPNAQDTIVTIELVQADGTIVTAKTANIPANGRFTFVAADYFNRYNLKDTDYIRFHSPYGLLGVEAGGDNDRTFMVALDGEN